MNVMLFVASALAVQAAERPAPTEAQFRIARAVLDRSLIDYPSARFMDVRGGPMFICGFVNAKNRLGAPTGWKRFAVYLGDEPSFRSDDGGDDIFLDVSCGEDGRKLTGADYSETVSYRPTAAPRHPD